MLRVFLAVWLLAIALAAAPAEAAVFLSGTRVVVPAGEVLREDAYVAGAQVEIDGAVEGDLVVVGGVVTVRGRVEGDLTAAAGRLTVVGPVEQASRLAAAEVTVAGPVGGDLLVAAGTLKSEAATVVGGESVLRAGEAELWGRLGRRLQAVAGDMLLQGTVRGPVLLEAPRLRIGDGALIEGPLRIRTATPNPIAPGARILEEVSATLIEPETFWQSFGAWALRLGMALVAGLAFLWLWPEETSRVASAAIEAPWLRVLLGLGVLIAAPFVAIMIMLTVLGLPLGLLLLGVYAAALYLAQLAVAWAAGKAVFERTVGLEAYWKQGLAYLAGLIVVFLLKEVPLLGPYATMVLVFWGLGALATASFRGYRRRHPPPPEIT